MCYTRKLFTQNISTKERENREQSRELFRGERKERKNETEDRFTESAKKIAEVNFRQSDV